MTLCETILADPAASYWLKQALLSALERDAVDALIDAEALAEALRERLGAVLLEFEVGGFDLPDGWQNETWSDGYDG